MNAKEYKELLEEAAGITTPGQNSGKGAAANPTNDGNFQAAKGAGNPSGGGNVKRGGYSPKSNEQNNNEEEGTEEETVEMDQQNKTNIAKLFGKDSEAFKMIKSANFDLERIMKFPVSKRDTLMREFWKILDKSSANSSLATRVSKGK